MKIKMSPEYFLTLLLALLTKTAYCTGMYIEFIVPNFRQESIAKYKPFFPSGF